MGCGMVKVGGGGGQKRLLPQNPQLGERSPADWKSLNREDQGLGPLPLGLGLRVPQTGSTQGTEVYVGGYIGE